MGLNSAYYNEIVFGLTQKRAELKLSSIEIANDEEVIERRKDFIKTNKRIIIARQGGLGCRGYRCSYAYVDSQLPIWFLHETVYLGILNRGYYGEEKLPVEKRVSLFGHD